MGSLRMTDHSFIHSFTHSFTPLYDHHLHDDGIAYTKRRAFDWNSIPHNVVLLPGSILHSGSSTVGDTQS